MTTQSTFDLDINNYTVSDLAAFLKVSPNYDQEELQSKEKNMIAINDDIKPIIDIT
jgi:hypothetical protein